MFSPRIAFALVGAALASVASANFHFMQIEHVVGGVCANPNAQAIQLRMRAAGQSVISGHNLFAFDATGANPVVIINFPGNVTVGNEGSRILITSPGFQATYGGPAADFVMSNLIPSGYFAAGRLTFEDPAQWALAWGGVAYTGTNTGFTTNDADGDFNPPVASMLPWTGDESLQFTGAATALSTTNLADYQLSASPVVLTNNGGAAAPLRACVFGDGFESGNVSGWSAVVP